MTMLMHIVVPRSGSDYQRMIAPGSGVVMYRRNGAMVIDFEGNLYGAANLRSYEDRLASAAGRALHQYPTTARMRVARPEDLCVVGEYETDGWKARFLDDATSVQTLDWWIGHGVT